MMHFTHRYFFPQWQGSPNPVGLVEGAKQLKDAFAASYGCTEIPVAELRTRNIAEGVWDMPEIVQQIGAFQQRLAQDAPQSVFTFGGDCSIDIAPIHYLHQRYGSGFGVLWLDAHTDVNIPSESPTKYFHGMPVRVLLGEGHKAAASLIRAPLNPAQFCYAGIRSIDAPEKKFLKENNMRTLLAEAINRGDYKAFDAWLEAQKLEALHIHLDLDVLDPSSEMPVTYVVERGIQLTALEQFLAHVATKQNIVGMTVTEYTGTAEDAQAVENIRNLIESVSRAKLRAAA